MFYRESFFRACLVISYRHHHVIMKIAVCRDNLTVRGVHDYIIINRAACVIYSDDVHDISIDRRIFVSTQRINYRLRVGVKFNFCIFARIIPECKIFGLLFRDRD